MSAADSITSELPTGPRVQLALWARDEISEIADFLEMCKEGELPHSVLTLALSRIRDLSSAIWSSLGDEQDSADRIAAWAFPGATLSWPARDEQGEATHG
jgi:hypothetical protein